MLLFCLQHSLSASRHCQQANGEHPTVSYIKKEKCSFTLTPSLFTWMIILEDFSMNYLKRLGLFEYVVISFWKWHGLFYICFGWGPALSQNPYLQKRISSALANAASYSYCTLCLSLCGPGCKTRRQRKTHTRKENIRRTWIALDSNQDFNSDVFSGDWQF